MDAMNLSNIEVMRILKCFDITRLELIKHAWSLVLFVFEIQDTMFFPVTYRFVALPGTLPRALIEAKFLKIRGGIEHISLDHITSTQLLLIKLDERSFVSTTRGLFLGLGRDIFCQLLGRFNHR